MMKKVRLPLFLCAMLVAAVDQASAALITFSDAATFDAANPGLAIEGFENANGGTQVFTGPLDSFTNNAAFSPGDILPGITFVDDPGPGSLFIAGPGQSTNPTTAIGSDFPDTDSLDILLSPGVTAIGFEIFQNFGGGSQSGVTQTYVVSVFNSGGLIGAFNALVPSGAAGFFGVQSTILGEITRISILGPEAFEVIDNVRFDATAVPEPATLLLLGTGLGAVAARRRLKKRA